MEVTRLGVKSELQLPAYAMPTHSNADPSLICDLHQSSQQCRIPDLLSGARDQAHIPMDTSQIRFLCAKMGTPSFFLVLNFQTLIEGLYLCTLQTDSEASKHKK